MNKELATTRDNGGQISVFSDTSQFADAQRMAKALCSSTLVPEMYRGDANLGNCLIALELANRTGASVLAVMQSMTPIHGKPSWSSAFLIATVNTCGRFTPIRFKFEGKEGADDWGCRAVAKDKESGEELVGSLITIGMAKAEGWHSKNGSKWKTMPEQMLTYRAAAFWTRAYAPEVSLGMHTSEEAVDIVNVTPLQKGLSPEKPNQALDTGAVVTDVQIEFVAKTTTSDLAKWLSSIPCNPQRLIEVGNREGWFEGAISSLDDIPEEIVAWLLSRSKSLEKSLKS